MTPGWDQAVVERASGCESPTPAKLANIRRLRRLAEVIVIGIGMRVRLGTAFPPLAAPTSILATELVPV